MKEIHEYIAKARQEKKDIDDWFQSAVVNNPESAVELAKQREQKIQRQIWSDFEEKRQIEYRQVREKKELFLKCKAGRPGAPFKSKKTDSTSGEIKASKGMLNISSDNEVKVNSTNHGNHKVSVSKDLKTVSFKVSCTGPSWGTTTRGHGWHEATLYAYFKYSDETIKNQVNSELLELQRMINT
ncbi:MAG: hypothetical protein WBA77_09950 [Microcoleaceae cyanobacterium]